MFCPRKFKDNDDDVLDHIEKCHKDAQAIDTDVDLVAESLSQNDEGLALKLKMIYQSSNLMTLRSILLSIRLVKQKRLWSMTQWHGSDVWFLHLKKGIFL